LVDGDFVTTESRPTAAYLVSKYGRDKKSTLYPETLVERARVDQRMYFDMGTFYPAFADCVVSKKLSIERSCTQFICFPGQIGLYIDLHNYYYIFDML
jgi:glutathione S-transferase